MLTPQQEDNLLAYVPEAIDRLIDYVIMNPFDDFADLPEIPPLEPVTRRCVELSNGLD